ncbi:MAG TPA: hypothetical protein VFG50_02315 [Rhodothermales bacterium]|nr:hypothetical protein [Rhodothermales bacterium]
MPRSPSPRKLIKDLEPDELRDVIVELCKLSKQNKQFLELYLLGSDAASPEPVVKEAKEKIKACIIGRGQFPRTDLRGARAAIREYSKVLKEYPQSIAELKLYYVEIGTVLTHEYGDMYESFYNSLASVFRSFCKDVKKHPSLYAEFVDRIDRLNGAAHYVGWGYGDDITYSVLDLRESVSTEKQWG